MNDLRTLAWLLAGSVLLPGCPVLPQRPPQPAIHDFGQEGLGKSSTPSRWVAISVVAPEWLQDPAIRYRLLYAEPTRVRFYSLARWAAAPPDLLAERLAAGRSASGWVVRLELQAFEQVFELPNRSAVLLQFHADVIDPITDSPAAERNFRFYRATRSADAAGAVEAFSRVVDEAARDLSRWVDTLPPPNPRPGS